MTEIERTSQADMRNAEAESVAVRGQWTAAAHPLTDLRRPDHGPRTAPSPSSKCWWSSPSSASSCQPGLRRRLQSIGSGQKAGSKRKSPTSSARLKRTKRSTVIIRRRILTSNPNCAAAIQQHFAKAFHGVTGIPKSFIPNGSRMTPAKALVFWLTSISKDPAHPFSAPTTDRQIFRFRQTRLVSGIPNRWGAGPVPQRSRLCSSRLCRPKREKFSLSLFDARGISSSLPSSLRAACPYLLEPWDVNNNGTLDAGTSGPKTNDLQTDCAETGIPPIPKNLRQPQFIPNHFSGFDGDLGGLGSVTATV